MWAQLMKMRVQPGKQGDLPGLFEQLRGFEQDGSGLIRTLAMQDQNDPLQAYVLVVFESEEVARARESDPRREEGMKAVRATMSDVFVGPTEFVDLHVLQDIAGS